MHLLDVLRTPHVGDDSTFDGVGLYPLWVNIKPRNFPPSTLNVHFSGLSFILAPLEGFEYLLEVLYMLVERVGFHDDVIHVQLHTPIDQALKDFVHKALIGRPDVLEAERHDLILVVGIGHHEGRLVLVLGVHTYLVIV